MLKKLQGDLTCPICEQLFQTPLLLPCGHTICEKCANKLWFNSKLFSHKTYPYEHRLTGSSADDALSEADSGVVVCVTDLNVHNNAIQSSASLIDREPCPTCGIVPKLPLDADRFGSIQSAQDWWPVNVALINLITRIETSEKCNEKNIRTDYGEINQSNPTESKYSCQLCSSKNGHSFCEQCKVYYCEICLKKWHPASGLLAKHDIRSVAGCGSDVKPVRLACFKHAHQICEFYCSNCAVLVCTKCIEGYHGEVIRPKTESYASETHLGHLVLPASVKAKQFKADITRLIQTVSLQAKRGGDLVHEFKTNENKTKHLQTQLISIVDQQIDALIEKLQRRRAHLIELVRGHMTQRGHQIRSVSNNLGNKLISTTRLLQLGVELLKERDAAAFIQVVPSLYKQLNACKLEFKQQLQTITHSKLRGDFEFRLSSPAVFQMIEHLYLQPVYAPASPKFNSNECYVNGNSIHMSWRLHFDSNSAIASRISDSMYPQIAFPHQPMSFDSINRHPVSSISKPTQAVGRVPPCTLPGSVSAYVLNERDYNNQLIQSNTPLLARKYPHNLVESEMCSSQSMNTILPDYDDSARVVFYLEIDNGHGGPYKVIYSGYDNTCHLEGLQFNLPYRLRVRAWNAVGYSGYSEVRIQRTARSAKFHLLPIGRDCLSVRNKELQLVQSAESISANLNIDEDRVLLANVSFSQGIHYWEWKIEDYDGRGQPSFGVAVDSVCRDKMLGLDPYAWSMYLNGERSWFVHNGQHTDRTEGGINLTGETGKHSVVGVRLDCDLGELAFYLNGQPHGPIAFSNLTDCARSTTNGNRSRVLAFHPALSVNGRMCIRLLSGLEAPSESEESSDECDATQSSAHYSDYDITRTEAILTISSSAVGSVKEQADNAKFVDDNKDQHADRMPKPPNSLQTFAAVNSDSQNPITLCAFGRT